MRAPKVTWAILALVVAAPATQAFASVQKGESPHDEITAVAAEAGWPEDAVEALQAAARQPDIDDLEPVEGEDGQERMDASVTYQPWHHCARQPPGGDGEAFNEAVAYVAEQRALAENLSLLDPPAAVRALGRALHALQDCFSHSNVVDLAPEDADRLARALVHGGPAPEGLRLCGVLPHSADMEHPPGDPYPHSDFNKDDAKSSDEAKATLPDGRTKYEAAHAGATAATRMFLVDFMQRLDGPTADRLLTARVEKEGGGGVLGVPALGVVVLPILAVAAALRRRRA